LGKNADQTTKTGKSAFFPYKKYLGKKADQTTKTGKSALFIWESAPKFMLRTCGLLSGKKNLPRFYTQVCFSLLLYIH
jgi:hypothetical protein